MFLKLRLINPKGSDVRKNPLKAVSAIALVLGGATAIFAQVLPPPTPGATNPTPSATKPGADLVINPTDEECKKGWNAGLKWTREQFEQFCAAARAAK